MTGYRSLFPVRWAVWLLIIALFTFPASAPAAHDNPPGGKPTAKAFLQTLTAKERAWLHDHPVITVVQDPGWPPVEFADEKGEPSGMSNDYLDLVEQRLGRTFTHVKKLSWSEAYPRLQRGEIDMTTSVAVTPERSRFWAFTKPYMNIPIVIAAQMDVTYIADMRELFRKPVAVVRGYAIEDWLRRDYPEILLVLVPTTLDGLKKLQRGEVFAYIDNQLVIGYYQAKMKVSTIKIAGQTPYVNAQCMAVRKDWPVLASILQKALDSISEEERMEIYKKWLPIRYEHGFDYTRFWQMAAVFAAILLVLAVWIWRLVREIESRKRAERALTDVNEILGTIIRSSPLAVIALDPDGNVTRWNPAAERMFGWTEEEVLGKFLPLVPEDKREEHSLLRERVLRGEGFTNVEASRWRKDGSSIDISISTAPLRDPAGRIIGVMSVSADITESKRDKEALRESEERYRTVVEESFAGVYVVQDGRFVYANRNAASATGYAPEELVGRDVYSLVHPDDVERIKASSQQMLEGRDLSPYEFRIITNDGQTRWVIETVRSISYMGRKAVLGNAIDITERKEAEAEKLKLEARLIQAQKMEAVGLLAGGLAHDFNNMLGVILGYTEMIKDDLPPDDPLRSDITQIEEAAIHSRNMTQQLLAFSRKQIISPELLDMNEALRTRMKTISRLIGEDVELIFRPGKDLFRVRMDPSQVDQILFNLAGNARDAMPQGGTLIVETANTTMDEGTGVLPADRMPGRYVQLSISDNGTGMPREIMDQIFDPFFTTKELGRGTGLGLATVYGIVRQNHGFINVYSEPGHGTIFKVYLPRSAEEGAPRPKPPEAPPAMVAGKILLVEDEPMLMDVTTRMLEAVGYRVLAAATPSEALSLIGGSNADIRIMLTDVVMPEMSGRELMEKAVAVKPGLKVLFMSGYTSNVIAHHGVLNEGVHFIQKPFRKDDLARKIAEVAASE
jgi:PAS domain S-box-containing protein